MARASRFKSYREESSKGHVKLGELIRDHFPMSKVYQEYPMDLILKRGYRDQGIQDEFQDQFMLKRARSLRVDWVVLDWRLILEFHGEHHYKPVDYGDGTSEEAHQHRLHLDGVKRRIAKEADFRLIEWPHWEPLTESSLAAKIDEVLNDEDNGGEAT